MVKKCGKSAIFDKKCEKCKMKYGSFFKKLSETKIYRHYVPR